MIVGTLVAHERKFYSKLLTGRGSACFPAGMTQRNTPPQTLQATSPDVPVALGSLAPASAIVLLVLVLITVQTGAGFGFA